MTQGYTSHIGCLSEDPWMSAYMMLYQDIPEKAILYICMHIFEDNIQIYQPKNSGEHHFFSSVNITFPTGEHHCHGLTIYN